MTSGSFGTLNPTLTGYFVHDAQDALAIIQLVLEGKLAIAHRRPKDPERQRVIQSGNVFVFKEMKGHIQRWTDGVTWSASRILTPFLVYRQDSKAAVKTESNSGVQKKPSSGNIAGRSMKNFHAVRPAKSRKPPSTDLLPSTGGVAMNSRNVGPPNNDNYYHDSSGGYYAQPKSGQLASGMVSHGGDMSYRSSQASLSPNIMSRQRSLASHGGAYNKPTLESHDVDYDLFGSLKDAHFAEDGLAKKTISVKYQGVPYRLISYFTKPDVIEGKLKRPSNEPMFRNVVIEKELWESVQENKTSLDMSELYYTNAPHGQFTALAPVQTYSGYQPPQLSFGGYTQELAPQHANLDHLSMYPDVGEETGGGPSQDMNKLHLSQNAPPHPSAQHYNLYSQTASPSHWYNDNASAYGVPVMGPYGKPSEPSVHNVSTQSARAQREIRHMDDRPISDICFTTGYENSSRFANGPRIPVPSSSSDCLTQMHHSSSAPRPGEDMHILSRQQQNNADPSKGEQSNDRLRDNNPLAESLDEPSQLGQHQDLLPPISPGPSPLEPPIRTGISATTFIPQNYDYGEPDDLNDAQVSQTDKHDGMPVEFRPNYAVHSHGTHGAPSATQSKAGPNIYFSTGRAWS